MSLRSAVGERSPALRYLAVAALLAAVGQVVLGGVVRVSGSGLGCPDWPLCDGRIVPSMELPTLIEYSHRLSAAVLGVLVLATTALAWRSRRDDILLTASSTAALALVVVAAVLGGITVLTELAWWIVLLHLGIAELVVACMVVASVAGWSGRDRGAFGVEDSGRSDWFRRLVLIALVSTLGLILLGSYVVGRGYGSACATWPLCLGTVLPGGEAYSVHMAHRIGAALVGLSVAAVAVSAWLVRKRQPKLLWPSLVVAGLFAAQTLVGAATVWTGFSISLKSIHLAMATLVWASLVYLAVLAFVPMRSRLERDDTMFVKTPGLEGVAP